MYCIHCGKEIADDSNFCPHCGKYVATNGPVGTQQMSGNVYRSSVDDDNIGWGVLGFFFPIVGLILFLVWNRDYPKRARMCGKGALIAVIVYVAFILAIVLIAIFFVALGIMASGGMMSVCV